MWSLDADLDKRFPSIFSQLPISIEPIGPSDIHQKNFLCSQNQTVEFYKTASRMLRNAGCDHYNIESYCKSGYRSKHTSAYWNSKPFYSFGLGSASYTNGVYFSRPEKLKDYTKYVQDLEDGLIDCIPGEMVDDEDLAIQVFHDSIGTADGLDLKFFREAFGDPILISV